MAVADIATPPAARLRRGGFAFGRSRLWLLVVPMLAFFVLFFVLPVFSMLALSLNKPAAGAIVANGDFTLVNFIRFFTTPLYYESVYRTVAISVASSLAAAVLGYPLAYLIAKTEHPGRNTALMILVLASMQLDGVIRLYGLMVLLGDNGLINGALLRWHAIKAPLPLMYNVFGVIVGEVQITLPFMVLSLIGVIRNIHPSLEETARSLGASPGQTFRHVILPLSMPGVLAGMLLVFALASSSYVVPALMGGWRVWVLPVHIYQQISNVGHWQFGACIATILFVVNIAAVFIYQAVASRIAGGRA